MGQTYYVDESGDLGWNFVQPYGNGGSSRYLVLASVCLPSNDDHRLERVMRDLYKASGWDHKKEKKWIAAPPKARAHFAQKAIQLKQNQPQVCFHAIVAKKDNVALHLQNDGNKLYNYMIRQMLVNDMAQHQTVDFYPDARSIKSGSSNSLHEYLDLTLGYELNSTTKLNSYSLDSQYSKNLQFTDFLAGTIHSHFEFNKSAWFNTLAPHITLSKLNF